MATARPFAYNPGSPISGTTQVGNLAIGFPTSGFTDSPQFWNGPDEELGYVIAQSVSGNTQPTPISGVFASVGFFRSSELTDESFINLTNGLFNQSFTTGSAASIWLFDNGYWTSWTGTTNTFTPGDFDFTDATSADYTSNTVTFTKSGTLYIYGSYTGGRDWDGYVYLNGVLLDAYISAANAITYKQTGGGFSDLFMYFAPYIVVDVNVGNTMYFILSAFGGIGTTTATITFSINNFSDNGGTVIDTFTDNLS
jgi:hypothetical protein